MQIKRLWVNDHLCLVDFEIKFNTINGGSSTILIGENGTGKSTMLETILEILMSFDSPSIEKNIKYDYTIEYEYAQKNIVIIKMGHSYQITIDEYVFEGSYQKINAWFADNSIFPKRIITFYSGAKNKVLRKVSKANRQYNMLCRKTIRHFLRVMNDDTERFMPNFPQRKYNYCDEKLTPIYLTSILCGHETFEKEYLIEACSFNKVEFIDMSIDMDSVEKIFGRPQFEGDVPTSLYYLTDFIDHRFTDLLRSGFMYSHDGVSYFEIKGLEEIEADSISILEFFEKLSSLFDAQYEVTVSCDGIPVRCNDMSEGQRQLIKILGMLGICKTEDCLVLMDEPDAHMNPKWKYEIEQTIAKSLQEAINTQAIIATHDPLVINGVSKEFIRIFAHNKVVMGNEMFSFTKVIAPTEDTEGLGIDGLLQSEYYGLPSVLDSETKEKMDKKHTLLVKKKYGTITDEEMQKLLELTTDLENMSFSRNIPTDSYYDEYVAAMHKIYSERPKAKLTAEDIAERNAKAEEILRGLLGK